MSEMAATLTKQERSLRTRFVDEYLKDYDAIAATIRLGYSEQYAQQYAKKFMVEPYTLKAIADKEQELGLDTEEAQHRRKIVSGLYREAHSRFNSGSARVAALTQLAKIVGIEAPVKTELAVNGGEQDLSKLSLEELKQFHELMQKAHA